MDITQEISGGGTTLLFDQGTGILFNLDAKLKGGKFGPSPSVKTNTGTGASEVAEWGSDNLWPQRVVEELRESDLLRPLARKQAKRLIGGGLAYGVIKFNEKTGKEERKQMRVPEIEKALRRTNHKLFLYESFVEYLTHGNAFAELQTDFDGKVVGLFNQDCCRCRLSLKDDLGRINKSYVSGKWPDGARPGTKDVITIDALDPYYDVAGQIQRGNKGRYILPLRILLEDNDYYGVAPWHSLITGPYLELAKAIIKCKLYLAINLSLIRYHVEVSSEFWALAFPGFNDLDPDKQREKKEEVKKAFTNWAIGVEKAGRTLMTEMVVDDVPNVKKEHRSLWKITPIKLEIPTGAYVEDSAEVDAKIIRAFMDMSLYGSTPSKDRNSAGSGSDKRIAHSQELLDNQADMDLLLTPFEVMADVNGWHEKYGDGEMIVFWLKGLHTNTADVTQGMVTEKPIDSKAA